MGGRGGPRKRKNADEELEAPMSADPQDEDYALKRKRNNVAVNKTRQKKKQEEAETNTKVNQLKAENQLLEKKVAAMQSELELLKEMIVAVTPGASVKDKKNTQ